MDDSIVRLMHYDPRWRQEFQQTRSSLFFSCQGWVTAVEHIGSTAIPGLVARPIIDCIAGVKQSDDFESASLLIEGMNFRRVDAPDWAEESWVLAKPRHGEATHIVLLAVQGSTVWRRALAIRDYLLARPEEAVRFEEAKIQRWRNHEGDQSQYERDKSLFFSHLLDQIESAGSS